MSRYIITPWRLQSDLLAIRNQFYQIHNRPDATDLRRDAVDRVMAWKLRGNLPHAIESTALLTDAILHHAIPDNSVFSVRAVYSAAFTRFVTGFCDIGRNRERSLEPSSMLVIAKQINMPAHFVALRHEATHEDLPSMQRLVRAVDEALQWLWTVYWCRLEEPDTDEAGAGDLAALRKQAKHVLRSYRTARLDALRSTNKHENGENLLQTGDSCINLFERHQSRIKAFVDVLVQERILMPQKRELGAPIDGAFLIWGVLLDSIAQRQKRFLFTLVQAFLESLSQDASNTSSNDVEKEGAFLWISHLLNQRRGMAGEPDNKSTLRREAMKWCCVNPGHWSTKLGESILRSGDDDFINQWREIFDASQLDFELVTAEDARDSNVASGDKGRDDTAEGREYADAGSWVRAAVPVRGPIGSTS